MSTGLKRFAVIPLSLDNVLSFAPYLPAEAMDSVGEEGCYGFGLVEGNLVSGAILGYENAEEGILEILQLVVDGAVRRCGGGTMLYMELLQQAVGRRMNAIAIRYDYPQDAELQEFLQVNHFQIYETAGITERYGLFALLDDFDETSLSEDEVLTQGRRSVLSAMPMLRTIGEYLEEKELDVSYLYPESGNQPPRIIMQVPNLKEQIYISIEVTSEESAEYVLLFSFVCDGASSSKMEAWQEEHDGINLQPLEEGKSMEFLMGVALEGGTVEEEQFLQYFAQFVGEVSSFF